MNQTNNQQSPMPESLTTLLQVAAAFVAQGKVSDAILVYDKVIEQEPALAVAFYERGRARHLAGDARGAMDDLKRALQLDPSLAAVVSGEFAN